MKNNNWVVAASLVAVLALPAQADDGLLQSQQRLTDDLDTLRDRVEALEDRPEWPEGRYCVFRSGSCPSGFAQSDGRLAALWMYRGGGTGYIKPMQFGNSFIGWYYRNSPKNANSEFWHGDILLSVCCKRQ